MKRTLAVLLSGGLLCGPAPGVDITGKTITLTDEEHAACQLEGGCLVGTVAGLARMVEQAKVRALLGCKGAT